MFFLIDGKRTACEYASFVQMGDVFCLFVVGTGFGETAVSALDNLKKLTEFGSEDAFEQLGHCVEVLHHGGVCATYEITHIETTRPQAGYIDCIHTDMIFCTLEVVE